MKANHYLNFAGNTEEAFNFYKSIFGGEFTTLMRFKDIPGNDQTPADAQNMIMHVALPMGDAGTLMGTDAPKSMGFNVIEGNNHHIALAADSKAEADKLFNGLSAGGKVEMPLADQFWGSYYGSFKDKFGTQWMVSYDAPKS
jgi:PhnB protein